MLSHDSKDLEYFFVGYIPRVDPLPNTLELEVASTVDLVMFKIGYIAPSLVLGISSALLFMLNVFLDVSYIYTVANMRR